MTEKRQYDRRHSQNVCTYLCGDALLVPPDMTSSIICAVYQTSAAYWSYQIITFS